MLFHEFKSIFHAIHCCFNTHASSGSTSSSESVSVVVVPVTKLRMVESVKFFSGLMAVDIDVFIQGHGVGDF